MILIDVYGERILLLLIGISIDFNEIRDTRLSVCDKLNEQLNGFESILVAAYKVSNIIMLFLIMFYQIKLIMILHYF